MLLSIPTLRYALSALAMLLPPLLVGSNIGVAAPRGQTTTPTPATAMLLTDPLQDPKELGVQWFAATGHTLRGAFLDYWNKYGGLAQFGYPITEEFVEPVGPDNKPYMVQYFERNRFELHPENKDTPYEVLVGTLGRDFRTPDPAALPLPPPATYFNESGHNLGGAFRSYWETHGGVFVHGYPITEPIEEKNPVDGKLYMVQYFERSRFELHPENVGTPYEVLLGLLGTQLAQKKGYFSGLYPRYGYAVDFSWISGRVEIYVPTGFSGPYEGCAIFRYGREQQERVQLSGSGKGKLHGGGFRVAVGWLARPGEPFTPCLEDSAARGYITKRIEINPVP